MNVPVAFLDDFLAFVGTTYGVKVTRHDDPKKKRGEHARFVLGESLFVVREHGDGEGASLEVFSSDRQKRQDMEKLWNKYLAALMQERMVEDDRADDGPDSGGSGEAVLQSRDGHEIRQC